jgi:peptide/nickel transport system permease protein
VNLRREVGPDLQRYFPATLELVLAALLVAVLLGIPLGLISAVWRDRWPDQIARVLSLAGVSLPGFWIAIILQIKIAFEVGWLPISGRFDRLDVPPESITGFYVVDSLLAYNLDALQLSLKYLALPALCLSFGALATVARTVRADALEVLGTDYIRTARATGIPENALILKYTLKNASLNMLTQIGLFFGYTLTGSVLVENIFSWPGVGHYAVSAALTKDYVPLMGVTLLMGLAIVLVNLITDVLYAVLDPRIRYAT